MTAKVPEHLRNNFMREGLKIETYTGGGAFRCRVFPKDDPSDYFGPSTGIVWFGGAKAACLAQMGYWLDGYKKGKKAGNGLTQAA